jgi:hypothetical protein
MQNNFKSRASALIASILKERSLLITSRASLNGLTLDQVKDLEQGASRCTCDIAWARFLRNHYSVLLMLPNPHHHVTIDMLKKLFEEARTIYPVQ